ncbi:uncharacterized protein METZ01_LOCUS490033 [marine metagenome]|uniref:Zinc-ribbon domain-containing protein n=1 Tax=marine metagenome TaxID=408172 RepID=A0A383CYT5_9ZZZZ
MAGTKECPNCGAEIPDVSVQCEFCSYEIKDVEIKGANHIEELEHKLLEAENSVSQKDRALYGDQAVDRKVISVIQSFSMPTTKSDLIELLVFAYTNYEGQPNKKGFIANPIKSAWRGKAKQAYVKLKIYAKDDDYVSEILKDYEDLSSSQKPKKKKWFGLF